MADQGSEEPLAPRRSLGGPILPPPPAGLADQERRAAESRAAVEAEHARKQAERQAARQAKDAEKADRAAKAQSAREQRRTPDPVPAASGATAASPPATAPSAPTGATVTRTASKRTAKRPRRAQLRVVQIDAWSVMKTAFLLSIAIGIVFVVAVAIIWSVLGAAGVWSSLNSILDQVLGSPGGQPFDVEKYVGTSRVVGITTVLAVVDVFLITAIATLGAFLYNLSAALLGGIEVTLAEDA